jgi:AcrR family transcriptional regulator
MARRPSRSRPRRQRPQPAKPGSDRERIVRAFMQLLAEKPIERIDLTDIAEAAGVSLARLRAEFGAKLAILAAQTKEIDRQVLEGGDRETEQEPPRERLLDVLMRRLEAMQPHKGAVRSLMCSAMCRPGLALALNVLTARSMRWMLNAAGIGAAGPKGALRVQGLALLYAQVLRVWVDDNEPGLERTMAYLDRALTRGQNWSQLLDDVCALTPPRRGPFRRRARGDEAEEAA